MLRNVLSYHLVGGNVAASDLMAMTTVSTLQGLAAEISVTGETVMFGSATVIEADMQASNGVVHAIDTVLIPPTTTTTTVESAPAPDSAAMEDSATAPDSATMAESDLGCSQDYVVQAGDSLSLIASNFYGDLQAFSTIVAATNAAAENQTYAAIDDPNLIVVGQTLCIPANPVQTTSSPAAPSATENGGTGAQVTPSTSTTPSTTENETLPPQTPGSTGTTPSTTEDEAMLDTESMTIDVPEGMGLVIFENLSSFDLIVDLSGPTPDSLIVPPGAKQQFILEPGDYGYNGHQPGGEFAVAPGQFDLTTQTPVHVICYDSEQCQAQSSSKPRVAPQP
jgi:LysM repeat protein